MVKIIFGALPKCFRSFFLALCTKIKFHSAENYKFQYGRRKAVKINYVGLLTEPFIYVAFEL